MVLLRAFWAVVRLAFQPLRHSEAVAGWLSVTITVLLMLGLVGAGLAGAFLPSPGESTRFAPQWILIIAYPAIILAVLFLIAAVRLQLQLQGQGQPADAVIAKLSAMKTQDSRYANMAEMLRARGHVLAAGADNMAIGWQDIAQLRILGLVYPQVVPPRQLWHLTDDGAQALALLQERNGALG
jgi:hypothetical protein